MRKPKIDRKRALAWRVIATITLLAGAVYILSSHWHIVSSSLTIAFHSSPLWLLAAIALMTLTFCIASAMYGVLALHRLRLRETFLIQLAASFVGRLLPAGLGGLGLNGLYLYRRRHTPAEATAVVSVNNLIGMAAHLLLLVGVIELQPAKLSSIAQWHTGTISRTIVFICIVVIICLLLLSSIRRQLVRFALNLAESVKKEKPQKLFTALVLACFMTATYSALLSVSVRAVGAELGLVQTFIVFSFGVLAGTATPTPGGLVGTEAGLFAGFTAYGLASDQAGAAVLVFRLISYWLPLLPGMVVLWTARNRKLV